MLVQSDPLAESRQVIDRALYPTFGRKPDRLSFASGAYEPVPELGFGYLIGKIGGADIGQPDGHSQGHDMLDDVAASGQGRSEPSAGIGIHGAGRLVLGLDQHRAARLAPRRGDDDVGRPAELAGQHPGLLGVDLPTGMPPLKRLGQERVERLLRRVGHRASPSDGSAGHAQQGLLLRGPLGRPALDVGRALGAVRRVGAPVAERAGPGGEFVGRAGAADVGPG